MGTKIQINSLEALERLIGGDSELEIEIRNSVVQQFSKKHLKSLATDDLMKSAEQSVCNEVESKFFDIIEGRFSKTKVFKKEVLNDLENFIKNKASNELRSIINDILEEYKQIEKINNAIEESVTNIMNSLTETRLNYKIDKLVEKRIKEKLGIS